jgi:hypothetical protein
MARSILNSFWLTGKTEEMEKNQLTAGLCREIQAEGLYFTFHCLHPQ